MNSSTIIINTSVYDLSFLSYPMGAQCGRKFINREEYEKVGLQYEHGYSILDVQQDEALR